MARETWHSDELPTAGALQRATIRDLLLDLRRLPGLLVRTIRAVAAVIRHRRTATVHPPRPILDAPRTSFNGAITPRRSFATASLSLDSIRTVRRAFDAPFTDVGLAPIRGALREWLLARGELPAKSLLAGVPVANDDALGSTRLIGNKVSNIFTSLGTNIT